MATVGEKDELAALIGHIPACATETMHNLECCCGRKDCAYLKHNCSALEDLEKEVHTAATLGQALLVRHEQYMHDAERDREEMNEKIERLEYDKKELEDANQRTVEENRVLLEQLEGLNNTAADSEIHIKSLESTLQSTRHEIRRLEILAARTYDLEVQLAALEQEQDTLRNTLAKTEAEERSAIQRWKTAERCICDMQDELERIEREAREERERHVEVMGRMERQRIVEQELDSAVGQLKAAAATTGPKNGTNVVSHFVKDILQDNANLQLGIMELREMLMNSNDEVQSLREQLMLHQPVDNANGTITPTLQAELASKVPEQPIISQELHIHHHYHGPKKEDTRRPKKKRVSLSSAVFTPPRHSQAPRSPRPPRGQDVANAILSQTSVTVPGPQTPNRWSMQSGQMSDFAPSSVPSSPQSTYRNSMIFDRGFDLDSSRPTSPSSSIDPMSPMFPPHRHRKRGSEVSARNIPVNFQPHNVIHEEDDDVQEIPLRTPRSSPLSIDTSFTKATRDIDYISPTKHHDDHWDPPSFEPTLHHTTSHESIISISGLDIHTLKSRPSQLTMKSGGPLYRPRAQVGTPSLMVSVNTAVTARPTLSRGTHDSTSYLRSSMLADRSDARSISSGSSGATVDNNKPGGKLGGWVFGRWGVSPAKSLAPVQRAVSSPLTTQDPLRAFMGRAPGINQKGPIPGFVRKVEKAPSKVTAEAVDHAALAEILTEDVNG